jgi:hypothetical protein
MKTFLICDLRFFDLGKVRDSSPRLLLLKRGEARGVGCEGRTGEVSGALPSAATGARARFVPLDPRCPAWSRVVPPAIFFGNMRDSRVFAHGHQACTPFECGVRNSECGMEEARSARILTKQPTEFAIRMLRRAQPSRGECGIGADRRYGSAMDRGRGRGPSGRAPSGDAGTILARSVPLQPARDFFAGEACTLCWGSGEVNPHDKTQ